MMIKQILIVGVSLLALFTSCDEPKTLAILSGKIIDYKGDPVVDVQYELFIDNELRKTEKYGETFSVYKNGKKIREFRQGYFFTDSSGKFSFGRLLEEIKENSEIKIVFKKEGYESFSMILNKSVTLDTVLQINKIKN